VLRRLGAIKATALAHEASGQGQDVQHAVIPLIPYTRHIARRMKGVPEELRLSASRTAYPHISSAPVEVPQPEVDQAAELVGHLGGLPQVDQVPQHHTPMDLADDPDDLASVSYSIPVPGVGDIGIDVPMTENQ